jgi:hypothetical protein
MSPSPVATRLNHDAVRNHADMDHFPKFMVRLIEADKDGRGMGARTTTVVPHVVGTKYVLTHDL